MIIRLREQALIDITLERALLWFQLIQDASVTWRKEKGMSGFDLKIKHDNGGHHTEDMDREKKINK